jgi:predicted outer membrane repeat protein
MCGEFGVRNGSLLLNNTARRGGAIHVSNALTGSLLVANSSLLNNTALADVDHIVPYNPRILEGAGGGAIGIEGVGWHFVHFRYFFLEFHMVQSPPPIIHITLWGPFKGTKGIEPQLGSHASHTP